MVSFFFLSRSAYLALQGGITRISNFQATTNIGAGIFVVVAGVTSGK